MEIFETVYCLKVHLSFDVTVHCPSVCAKPLKNNIFGFFGLVFPLKTVPKLNIWRMAWQILMILVSFCRILDGLSRRNQLVLVSVKFSSNNWFH